MNKKILLIGILILAFLYCSLTGQESEQSETAEQITTDGILIEEDIIDAEISIRVPESSIQPRTRTEELNYTLNYLREILIQSNRQLY